MPTTISDTGSVVKMRFDTALDTTSAGRPPPGVFAVTADDTDLTISILSMPPTNGASSGRSRLRYGRARS